MAAGQAAAEVSSEGYLFEEMMHLKRAKAASLLGTQPGKARRQRGRQRQQRRRSSTERKTE